MLGDPVLAQPTPHVLDFMRLRLNDLVCEVLVQRILAEHQNSFCHAGRALTGGDHAMNEGDTRVGSRQ